MPLSTLLKVSILSVALITVAALWTPAHASDPVGVYSVIRKIKFEPDATHPKRVRVCGAFALSNLSTFSYDDPKAGYMYYKCPAGQTAACLMQWRELSHAATTGQCVGFGQRRDPRDPSKPFNNGRIRQTVPASRPDFYPVGMGVVVAPPGGEAKKFCDKAAALPVPTTGCDGLDDAPTLEQSGGDSILPDDNEPQISSQGGCTVGAAPAAGWGVSLLGGVSLALLALRRRRARR